MGLLNTAGPSHSAWSKAAFSLDCGVMGGLQLSQLLLMLLQLSCQALQLLRLALSFLLGLLGAPAGRQCQTLPVLTEESQIKRYQG